MFDATHVEIRRWFTEQLVDGLRVDHPDGLRDPGGYLRDLATLSGEAYVLVEKILEPGEHLLTSWATAGTTGYDALGMVDRVLTDPAGADRLPFADLDWHAMIHGTKRAVADGILGSETRRIVRDLSPERTEDPALVDAVAELLACFPVYRSYLPEGREHLDAAFAAARAARPDLAEAFDRLEPVLHDPEQPAALRFQQTSGMVMAKGVEDCAFYRYPRLTSLTEVGGDPSEFSLSVAGFHEAMASRQRDWPHAMTCTTTHDTKRGEDVRARIAVLAEVPEVWASRLRPPPDRSLRCPTRPLRPCCGRRCSARGTATTPTCGPGCTPTPRRRCGRPATAPPGRHPTRPSSGRCTPPSTPPSTPPRCARCSTSCSPSWSRRAAPTRWRPSCWRSRSRACPTSTRARSCGRPRWSTPTTGVRSTSTCARAVLDGGRDHPAAAKLRLVRERAPAAP